jgi:hypothetical protein
MATGGVSCPGDQYSVLQHHRWVLELLDIHGPYRYCPNDKDVPLPEGLAGVAAELLAATVRFATLLLLLLSAPGPVNGTAIGPL